MKKYCCIFLAFLSVLFLVSCQKGQIAFLEDEDHQLADTCIDTFYRAVQNRDQDAVEKLLSSRAHSDAGDIETQIDEMFEFIKGEPISWNREESPVVEDISKSGATTKHEMFWVSLETSEDVYFVFFSYYPMDRIAPDNEGIYAIRILRACDENELEGSINRWSKVPGITILDNSR